ncbi:MAG: hypothetical protein Q4A82_05815 [Corynebacterium sp.]|nr:hypothetical protein [Corynebacterium sp.]
MTISHVLFSIAGVLLLLTFGYHIIWGNAAYAKLRPERNDDEDGDKKFTAWLNGRAVFQMGSIDLLLPAALLILMGFKFMEVNVSLLSALFFWFLGYALFWLLSILFSKGRNKMDYAKQGQWILFLVVAVLVSVGATKFDAATTQPMEQTKAMSTHTNQTNDNTTTNP